MIRLLLLGFALYLAARVFGGLVKSPKRRVDIKGEAKKESLDLSKEDIQDVEYKEIKSPHKKS